MKSETLTIQNIFQDRRQYCVPFYQRAYVWTLDDQWEQLWNDIRDKAEARLAKQKLVPHFLGAVVLDPQPREGLIGVDTLHIIDGQQRLTTLQFVLASIRLTLQTVALPGLIEFIADCLRNSNQETMRDKAIEVFKVWPTFRDRSNFRLAFTADSLEELRSRFPAHFTQAGELRKVGAIHPPALAAIWYFTRAFQNWLTEESEHSVVTRAESLIMAVTRDLKVVSIVLDGDDDAQIIFETLNGRGAQLHATDLIRNYLFMRADRDGADSESLYDTLWAPFETEYWSIGQRRGRMTKPRLEWLIHSSLQAELREEIDLGRLYFEYRRFATGRDKGMPAEEQLLKLQDYAQHYKELIAGSSKTPIGRFGARIAPYDVTTLYPLALLIAVSGASDDAKGEMYAHLISYLVRRAVCGLTPKNYNNVFITVLRQLAAAGLDPLALRKILSGMSGDASRWPADAEFRNSLVTAPLYPGRLDAPRMRALLTELEAGLRMTVRTEERALPDLADLDIDHILPQSWFAHWPLPDGRLATSSDAEEVRFLGLAGGALTTSQASIATRQTLVPTLGNLTLLNLSVNREAQNYEYHRKRKLLIDNTSLRLNIALVARSMWDEDGIAQRSEELADAALAIWEGPLR